MEKLTENREAIYTVSNGLNVLNVLNVLTVADTHISTQYLKMF